MASGVLNRSHTHTWLGPASFKASTTAEVGHRTSRKAVDTKAEYEQEQRREGQTHVRGILEIPKDSAESFVREKEDTRDMQAQSSPMVKRHITQVRPPLSFRET